jgi:hypothetical protein
LLQRPKTCGFTSCKYHRENALLIIAWFFHVIET